VATAAARGRKAIPRIRMIESSKNLFIDIPATKRPKASRKYASRVRSLARIVRSAARWSVTLSRQKTRAGIFLFIVIRTAV
jgi:hypothetical protein